MAGNPGTLPNESGQEASVPPLEFVSGLGAQGQKVSEVHEGRRGFRNPKLLR